MIPQFKSNKFPDNAVHISLDLETLSTASNAAIAQIGAAALVASAEDTIAGVPPVRLMTFAQTVAVESNDRSLDISKETMEWWGTQDADLRKAVLGGTRPLEETLTAFLDWCQYLCKGDFSRIVLWGNGADFDITILRNAFELYYTWPFSHRNHHSLRTLKATVPEFLLEEAHRDFYARYPDAVTHNAEYDAVYQLYQITAGLAYFGEFANGK